MYQSKKPYVYGTGRRKSSVARVRLYPNGTGAITINGRDIDDYFGLETLKLVTRPPLVLTDTVGNFVVVATVSGGGEGAEEVRPQGSPPRSPVLQALIGVSNWFKNAQKPRKTAVFRGFSISHLLFQFVCFWQDLNCSDPVFLD